MAAEAPEVRVLAARLVAEVSAAGFELVAHDGRLEVYGDGEFPDRLGAQLAARKGAVLALLRPPAPPPGGWLVCPRHQTDYRPWCGGCGPAFNDDGTPSPVAAPDHAARVAARLAADGGA